MVPPKMEEGCLHYHRLRQATPPPRCYVPETHILYRNNYPIPVRSLKKKSKWHARVTVSVFSTVILAVWHKVADDRRYVSVLGVGENPLLESHDRHWSLSTKNVSGDTRTTWYPSKKNEQKGADVLRSKNHRGEVSLTEDVSLFYCVYLKFTLKIEKSHAIQIQCCSHDRIEIIGESLLSRPICMASHFCFKWSEKCMISVFRIHVHEIF